MKFAWYSLLFQNGFFFFQGVWSVSQWYKTAKPPLDVRSTDVAHIPRERWANSAHPKNIPSQVPAVLPVLLHATSRQEENTPSHRLFDAQILSSFTPIWQKAWDAKQRAGICGNRSGTQFVAFMQLFRAEWTNSHLHQAVKEISAKRLFISISLTGDRAKQFSHEQCVLSLRGKLPTECHTPKLFWLFPPHFACCAFYTEIWFRQAKFYQHCLWKHVAETTQDFYADTLLVQIVELALVSPEIPWTTWPGNAFPPDRVKQISSVRFLTFGLHFLGTPRVWNLLCPDWIRFSTGMVPLRKIPVQNLGITHECHHFCFQLYLSTEFAVWWLPPH